LTAQFASKKFGYTKLFTRNIKLNLMVLLLLLFLASGFVAMQMTPGTTYHRFSIKRKLRDFSELSVRKIFPLVWLTACNKHC